MIANDPRRSFEFFTRPVAAGAASIDHELNRNQIIAAHALRGSLSALALALAMSITTSEPLPAVDGTTEMVGEVMEMMFASPLRIALINWLGGLLVVTLFWIVGRNFNRARNWFQVQSAITRYLLVLAFINFDFALAIYLTSFLSLSIASTLTLIQAAFGFYSFVNLGWVVQGVFGLQNTGQAFLVVLLTILSLIGASTFLGFFAMGFI